ncbi:MAG: hypothetical protein OXJ55_12190 [Caldilineaceae bacterium]|nr:hypothetical protein [Caldilineaceae bacterium]MDE0197112.1 hypothetical protein [Caldilineaceae bacterium]MDE0464442.1 hypothetical protein [Caldilineaceae bacterium]MXX25174.1 hypothetical protein [Caldilineaceae bacterium SB0668_bin_21]MYC22722.1 hypothetical protein [Caldilineaceae bacterium SB0662_bin_25]
MKNDRESLIARKHEVLRELTRARRQLEAASSADSRRQRSRRQQLEGEVEQLMAEEYRLRIAIDRSKY